MIHRATPAHGQRGLNARCAARAGCCVSQARKRHSPPGPSAGRIPGDNPVVRGEGGQS